jgi:vacuolar-type H+-ATPase subunit F/Vma7
MLEMGDWENFDNEDLLHQNRAKKQNAAMMQGQQVTVEGIDDDVVHITEHVKWMLSDEYEEITSQNPIIARIANIHVNEHMNSIAKKTTASMTANPQVQNGEQVNPAVR